LGGLGETIAGVHMSALIERIDRQIEQSSEASEQAELMAEKACYLARGGKFDVANECVRTLRRAFGNGSHPRISVWIMLVEGLLQYFQGERLLARDRILRAERISSSMVLYRLLPLTEVWLAHIAFNLANYEEMLDFALRAKTAPGFSCPDVQLRLAMAIADASLHSGDRKGAQTFYEIARAQAVNTGDQLAISAVMYNRAAHGLNLCLVEQALDDAEVSASDIKWYEMELDSAARFDAAIDARALRSTIDVLKCRSLVAKGRCAEAEEALARVWADIGDDGDRVLRAHILVNLARCAAERRAFSKARALANQAVSGDLAAIDRDDLVAISHLVFETTKCFGDCSEIERAEVSRRQAISSYRAERNSLEAIIPLLQDTLDR
jgi:hypothetical protein